MTFIKRRTLGLTVIGVLLFSMLAGTWFVNMGKASPISEVRVPSFGTLYIQIYSPEDQTYITNPVNFTVGAAIHYPTLDSFQYSVDEGPWISLPLHGAVGTFGVLESIPLNLSSGYHSIKAEAGFFGYTVRADVSFAVDVVSPYITVLSPENKTYSATEIPLTFETAELSDLRYVLDGQQFVSFSENTSLKGISDGLHNLIIRGTSPLGTDYASDIVYFEVDTQPPTVTVFPIENKTYNVPEVPLNFTVSEPTSWLGYSLDGKANVTVKKNATLTGLSYGLHELTVYANDTVGNMGASDTVYFSVAEPFPITLVLASVITVAIVSIGALMYFKKRKR